MYVHVQACVFVCAVGMPLHAGVCMLGCAYIKGCTYVVVHSGMHAYMSMHICSERNGSRGVFQVYFTRASLSGQPKCSDLHLHCSGPVMGISNLTDDRLSSSRAQ